MRKSCNGFLVFLSILLLVGCGNGGGGDSGCTADSDCAGGQICEVVQGGTAKCFFPLEIRGIVEDIIDDEPIGGSLVQAADPNGAALGTSAKTGIDGRFTLTVPATRDSSGKPVAGDYTLRAQASGYQIFPSAVRPALPLAAETAVQDGDRWAIDNALTTIKLLPLGDTSGLGSISGSILTEQNAGILVVAEGPTTTGYPGFSDSEGDYTIFNVPAGPYTVRGFVAGIQLNPANTTLTAEEDKTGVDLTESERALSSVSGNIQIVDAPGGSMTSVVLAVESTFVKSVGRGLVPPGLRVGDVTGNFTIENVPDGKYVVLAAFENDGLVRDPDETIAGTGIVRVELPDPEMGNTVTVGGFKVTEALEVFFPGAEGPEAISITAPTFQWAFDPSAKHYEVYVYDAFGNGVWSNTNIGSEEGQTIYCKYGGSALEEGMFYQFRAFSFNNAAVAISATEDLKGVFYLTNP
ncbi:MAG: carboxypeptidase regulatory-like domain-containing protein [Deltaproteobacteria bacterium]|nr:MAG: carboxypeptidase regulatory-like domain-containing protein [Deltaproteobacteria bacterium]